MNAIESFFSKYLLNADYEREKCEKDFSSLQMVREVKEKRVGWLVVSRLINDFQQFFISPSP